MSHNPVSDLFTCLKCSQKLIKKFGENVTVLTAIVQKSRQSIGIEMGLFYLKTLYLIGVWGNIRFYYVLFTFCISTCNV